MSTSYDEFNSSLYTSRAARLLSQHLKNSATANINYNQSTESTTVNYQVRGYNFAIEDTTDKCYRDITCELMSKGWKKVSYRSKRSKLERKRLPHKEVPLFVSQLNEKDVDFAELAEQQICNHFEGIHCLTTKRGFADVLHDMHWVGAASADISPRSFNLGDPVHREEFIDDFRLTAAVNILKIYAVLNSDSGANHGINRKIADNSDRSASSSTNERKSNTTSATHLKVNTTMLHTAIAVVQWHLRIVVHGEWSGVESHSFFKGRSECLEESGWRELVNYSYNLVAQLHNTHSDVNTLLKCMYGATKKHKKAPITGHNNVSESQSSQNKNEHSSGGSYLHKSALYLQVIVLLRMLHRVSSQFLMEGVKNIWVVKAPESSCGIGIKLFHKLQDILECERGMGGRTVQKYIETPLLARISSTETAERGNKTARSDSTQQQSMPRGVRDWSMFKFDLRIWVLVTSFQPLVAYIYPILYGRRCGNAYNSELSGLSDSYAHLTNYSVQKKAVKTSSNGSSNGNSGNTPRNVASMSAFELFQLQQKQQSDIAKAQQRQRQSACESSGFEEDDASVTSEHSASSNQTSSSAKKLRNMCSSFRDISPSVQQQQQFQYQNRSATPRGNRASDNSGASTQQVSEQELLMTHDEVVRVVEQQHLRNQQRRGHLCSSFTTTNSSSRCKDSISCDSHWQDVVWPEIKRKVVATLQVTQDRVVPRERSFQFLGYDVLLDAQLVPWILEVNMSPAMAHRNPQQSALIAAMCKGLVELAVLPWVSGDLGEGLEDCYRATPDEGTPRTIANMGAGNAGDAWEKLDLDTAYVNESSLTSNKQSTLPIASTPTIATKPYNLVAPSDDWTDITSNASSGRAKAMSRPKSASSAVRRKPLSIQQQQQQQFSDVKVVPSVSLSVPGLDSSFVLVARAVTSREILFADVCCVKFGRILLLQRWAVRYLSRVRLYHSRRKMASTRIQTLIRLYLAKCRVFHLKQQNAAVVVQKQTRRLLARLFCDRLRRTNAAVVLQSIVRRKLACILRKTLYRRLKSGVLVLWYHGRYAAKRRRAARKVVLMLQLWHRRRRHFAQIVLHSIALHFRKRVNRRVKIQRCFRCWRVRVRLFEALRLVTLKSLASTIAAEVSTRREEVQRFVECDSFEQEDALSFAVRQHSIAVESAAQHCAQSIWEELLRVEVVEIASYTMRYVHVVQTTDIESLLAKQFAPSTKKTLTLSSPPEHVQAVQTANPKQKKKSRSSHVSEPRHSSADSRQSESEEAHSQQSPDLDRLAARNSSAGDDQHDRPVYIGTPHKDSVAGADAPVSPEQIRKALSALSVQIDSYEEPQHELKSSRKQKKNVATTSKTSDVTGTTSGGVSLIERSLSLASTASPLSGKATNKLYGIKPTPPTTQQYMSAITQIRNRPWSDAVTTEKLPQHSGEQSNMRHNASNRTLKDLLGSAEIQSIHDLLAPEQRATEQTQKVSHSTSEKTLKTHTELFNLSVDGVSTGGRRSERRHSEGGGSGRQRPVDLTRQCSVQLLSPGFNEQAVQEASMRNAESILNRRAQKLKPQRPLFVDSDAHQSFSRVEMADHPVNDRPNEFYELRPQSGGHRPNRPWAETTLSSGNGADFVHIMSQQHQSTVDSESDGGWNEQLTYSHQPQYVEYNDLAALSRHREQHHQHHTQHHSYQPQTYDEVWTNAQLFNQTHENSPQFAQFSQFGQLNQFSEYHQHSPHQYQVFHPLDASAGLYDPDPQVEGTDHRQQVRRVRKHRGAEDPTSAHRPSSNSNSNPLRRSASAGRKRPSGGNKDKSSSSGGGGNGGGMKTSRSQKTK